ncbi:OadG family transporter subunit [Aliamphritea spongicola]|nr:OadG family transporter subunit [Aliamphritea spongicola]
MENLMSEGINLMVFGMGFVFVFLTLLVFATNGMSAVLSKIAPDPEPKAKRKPLQPHLLPLLIITMSWLQL